MLSYNSTPHCSTKKNPAELHIGRPLYNALDRLRLPKKSDNSDTNFVPLPKSRTFQVGDVILFRNYGAGPKWVSGKIVNQQSPVTFLITRGNNSSVTFKRHVNQIISHVPNVSDNNVPRMNRSPSLEFQGNDSILPRVFDQNGLSTESTSNFRPPSPCLNTRMRREIRAQERLDL